MNLYEESFLTDFFGGDEIELLQTDIQRFLAILAFCLLPIFMLVQSIPVVSRQQDAVIVSLSQRIDNQITLLNQLREENLELNRQIDRLLSDAKITDQLRGELNNALELIEQQKKQIDALLHDKISKRIDPAALKRRLAERDRKIKRLIREKDRFKRLLEETLKGLKVFITDGRKADSDKLNHSAEKGLYVAFESDDVFLELLNANKIQLFIHVDGMSRSFKVIQEGGHVRFAPGNPVDSLDLWEIEETMVPDKISRAFQNWTTLSSRKTMFIVGLSSELSRQIREKWNQGGRIVIGRGGKVHFRTYGE